MEIVIIIGALFVLVGVMATLVRYNNAVDQHIVKKVTPEIKPIAIEIEYQLTAKKAKPVQKATSNKTSQKRKTR